jgi:hypothetical protein
MGIDHPPALNDLTSVGRGRAALGVATLLFALTLVTLSPFEQVRIDAPGRGQQAQATLDPSAFPIAEGGLLSPAP